MSTFKFRLATLLRLRASARDQRRSDLAEAFHAEQVIREQRKSVAAKLAELLETCREAARPGALDLDRLLVARRYEAALRREDRDLAEKQEAIRCAIDRRREALVEADRSLRVLELLREKQQRAHFDKEARLETRRLDEVGHAAAPRRGSDDRQGPRRRGAPLGSCLAQLAGKRKRRSWRPGRKTGIGSATR